MDLTNYWGFLMKALNRKLQCYTAIESSCKGHKLTPG
jgi:hypothetical protein